MEVVEQGQQLISAAAIAGAFVMTGIVLALPSLQRLIEQQRSQRAREREHLRRCRMVIEA